MGDVELLALINTGKNIAALLVAIGVAGEFAGDWISGPINRRLDGARQEEMARLAASSITQRNELADAVARGKESDARIAEAQRGSAEASARAAKAQESLALAEQHAAEANTKAEGFRLDIAKANEGAARATETAERERLARLQLEARLADRVFTPDQQRRLTNALAPSKGITIDVSVIGDTLEIANFSGAVLGCLRQAGLLLNTSNPIGGGTAARGVLIGIKPGSPPEIAHIAEVIISILRESVGGGVGPYDFDKLVAGGSMTAVSQATGADKIGQAPIRLFIGSKQ